MFWKVWDISPSTLGKKENELSSMFTLWTSAVRFFLVRTDWLPHSFRVEAYAPSAHRAAEPVFSFFFLAATQCAIHLPTIGASADVLLPSKTTGKCGRQAGWLAGVAMNGGGEERRGEERGILRGMNG